MLEAILEPGTPIYVGELFVMPLPGEVPVRVFDEPTGLHLWPQGKSVLTKVKVVRQTVMWADGSILFL